MEQNQSTVDQNESDVLSMLRTAQASQLRRRGALRGGAERRTGARHSLKDSEVPLPDEVAQMCQSQLTPQTRQYRITCGHADAVSSSSSKSLDSAPPRPFPLPSASQRLKRKYAESFASVSCASAPSNGCGQLLDVNACYSVTMGCWITEEPLSTAPLEDQYTEILSTTETTWRRPVSLKCGCHRQGFGCIVCGNVVGTFLRMCPVHRQRATSPARDWRESKIVYCFLPSRVTSSPERPASAARDGTISASDASAEQTSQDESTSREGRTVIRRRLFPPTMPSYDNLIDAIHEQDTLDLQRDRDLDRDMRSRPARSYTVDAGSSPSWDPLSFPNSYSQQFSGLFPSLPHSLSNRPISPFSDYRHSHSRPTDSSEDTRPRTIESLTRHAERERRDVLRRLRAIDTATSMHPGTSSLEDYLASTSSHSSQPPTAPSTVPQTPSDVRLPRPLSAPEPTRPTSADLLIDPDPSWDSWLNAERPGISDEPTDPATLNSLDTSETASSLSSLLAPGGNLMLERTWSLPDSGGPDHHQDVSHDTECDAELA